MKYPIQRWLALTLQKFFCLCLLSKIIGIHHHAQVHIICLLPQKKKNSKTPPWFFIQALNDLVLTLIFSDFQFMFLCSKPVCPCPSCCVQTQSANSKVHFFPNVLCLEHLPYPSILEYIGIEESQVLLPG